MTTLAHEKNLPLAAMDVISAIKILSNANRYAIIKALLSAKRDLCVYELSKTIGVSQSATSHQLAYLEARGILRSVRTGKTKCYLLTDSMLAKKLIKIVHVLK